VKFLSPWLAILLIFGGCSSRDNKRTEVVSLFVVEHDKNEGTLSIFRSGGKELMLKQNARTGTRPYIHPIIAPDGKGELTEYSPAHHRHQTGLYWGLKQVNGRDYFMNWEEDYWQKVSADVLEEKGAQVKWRTIYNLLDEQGTVVLTETQTWSFRESQGKFILDLEWSGSAKIDITMGKFYVGGLFVRMPWREGIAGAVVNAAGQRNGSAEGQRARWNDVGIQIDGREDPAHIAILDHPDNPDFPIPWRVDNELGVGPSRQILGDWKIPRGEAGVVHYRLIVYTGDLVPREINDAWKEYVCEGI
jgi:hypothetical protein